MQWNDNILEENDVFIPERNCETTNDTGENIEEFSSTIEFVSFMDQSEETLVDGLSKHFSSGDQFGIELVKNVLQVISLNGLF